MEMKDSEFFKELLTMFKMESAEHMLSIVTGLADMDKSPSSQRYMEIAESVHRAAHSLKGAARTIGLSDVEPICQSLETFFSVLKRQRVLLPPDLKELLNRAVDGLKVLLESVNAEGRTTADKTELSRTIDEINNRIPGLNKQ